MNTRQPIDGDMHRLSHAAAQAMRAGDHRQAVALLKQLAELSPDDLAVWLQLAAANRAIHDHAGARLALIEVLRKEPRNFLALMMQASLLESEGSIKKAAIAYGAALAVAPPDASLEKPILNAVVRARQINSKHAFGLRRHLSESLRGLQAEGEPQAVSRIQQFLDMAVGIRQRYRQEPTEFFYPGLPAIEFWDRSFFPWIAKVETQTSNIQRELAAVLSGGEGFTPYVNYDPTLPLEQWSPLNRSPDWEAFQFFHQGRIYKQNCDRCPDTLNALSLVPQPRAVGRMPAAMFSVLKPKVRIPPHTGVANIRLVCHLPLVVPDHCGFRVGGETRQWRVGEAWVFDDTIEHEAWNDSDHIRIVMIFDIWNPLLSEWEREAISRSMAAMDEFNETEVTSSI